MSGGRTDDGTDEDDTHEERGSTMNSAGTAGRPWGTGLVVAVSVAVAVHADVRRKQGAPANRVYAPGSRLWASRWVAMGRSSQMTNQRR